MRAIQETAQEQKIPRGVGPLTFEILRREVGDWSRFNNRRQVSSYTGLCPREHSSGGKRRSGSVSKSGNPRVRAMLLEMVWRGMANDPVATRLHGAPEMGPRVEQSHAQPRGEEESRCGNSAAICRGFVESVYGPSGGGEIRVGVPARSGMSQKRSPRKRTIPKHKLSDRPPRVVGKQVMEVKEVTLTLVAPH